MPRLLTSLTALAAAGALIAGCGGSSNSSSSGGGGGGYGGDSSAPAATTTKAAPAASTSGSGAALALTASEADGLSFDHKTLSAKAGTVTIALDNPSSDSLPHAIAITGPGGVQAAGATVQPGGTSKVSLKLKPGKYTFFCPVGSHRAAGMEGTLTVR